MRRHIVSLVLLYAVMSGLALFSSGCSQSSLVNMWRDESFKQPPMKSMMVIVMRNDPSIRRLWEDGFVTEFAKHGVNATPSYRFYGDAIPDTQQVVETVKADKIEGVLISRRLPNETLETVVPGYVTTSPEMRYNPWTNMYYTYYRETYVPGRTDTSNLVRHVVQVWTTSEGGRLVWTGTGEFIDPTSSAAVNHEITGMVIPELEKAGMIPSGK